MIWRFFVWLVFLLLSLACGFQSFSFQRTFSLRSTSLQSVEGSRHLSRKNQRKEWLEQATGRFLTSQPGSLEKGKWHEVVSILNAWVSFAKNDPAAPLQMEALLKRLLDESVVNQVELTIDIYNSILDAWACAALFKTRDRAAQRAREILVLLQEMYEATGTLQPNRKSFDLVLHAVCKTEGPFIARRLLAWMEHLHKTGKNSHAQPDRTDYIQLLDAYASSNDENAGLLAEGFLRHMKTMGVLVDTLCYNIAIKAWNKARRGRQSAEHADRILEHMDTEPDLVTYASVISSWAASGMRAHAVTRVEELLRQIEERMQPNTVVLNAVMSTWVKSRSPGAVQRTGEILRLMEESNDPSKRPDLISFNTHLHALALHSQKNPEYAEQARSLLVRLEREYHIGASVVPNLFSYNIVIDACCRARQAMLAANVLRMLIKRDDIEPDTFSFNQVLSALSRMDKSASRMARDLLEYMEEAYQNKIHPRARPDVISYGSVLYAYSRTGGREAAIEAQALLDTMKSRYSAGELHLKPNRICYNSLINCWAKSGQGTLGARKAEALLDEMQRLWEHGDEALKPDIVTYNAVLNAWARSGTRCCGRKAETYLDHMWELYNAGDGKVKPNELSYNTVINAISKSKNERKAQKALRILRRMDKLYQAGNKEARPNEVTYTAVLNSCAFPAVVDPKARRRALDTAIFTLEELRSSRYGQPNQVTYGTFIKACVNLLPENDSLRHEVIERAFQQCCRDGQVGEMVLNYLQKALPIDLCEELLAIQTGARISVENLPLEWRCNVRDKDGWKVRPTCQVPRTIYRSDSRRAS